MLFLTEEMILKKWKNNFFFTLNKSNKTTFRNSQFLQQTAATPQNLKIYNQTSSDKRGSIANAKEHNKLDITHSKCTCNKD